MREKLLQRVVFWTFLSQIGFFSLSAQANPFTCNEQGLNDGIAQGGVVQFDCPKDSTITISGTKTIDKSTHINGISTLGKKVTISGGNAFQIFRVTDPAV